MYYHNSPTSRQLKALKVAKAVEMKTHLEAMKAITRKYVKPLTMLETLRRIELDLDNAIHQGRLTDEQIVEAQKVLTKNRKKAARVVAKFTDVSE